MEFQIEAQVSVHLFQRIIDCDDDAVYLALSIRLGVHIEHLPESRIRVRTGAMPEFLGAHRDVVIERYQLHIVLELIHHLVQIIRIVQRKRKQYIVTVELRVPP